MRELLTTLGLVAALASAGQAIGQGPAADNYEQDAQRSTGHHGTLADQVIYERASREAREREGRIESRHWYGISAQRPTLRPNPIVGVDLLYFGPWNYAAAPVAPYGVWVR